MMNTEEQYQQEWAAKTGRPASEVYVPEAIREVQRKPSRGVLEQDLHDFVDYVRESGEESGTWALEGFCVIPAREVEPLTIGLARFQSYRARTEAALVQELGEFVDESGAQYLTFQVDADSSTVEVSA